MSSMNSLHFAAASVQMFYDLACCSDVSMTFAHD